MRQLDLFAGIGGISLAAEWVGIETVAFCEKEPFCQDVLRRRFPGRPIYDDVFDLTREVLERDGIITRERGIDIVAGGFPCQPFSHAGKRTGTADDRYLWPEMCRIIGELRPAWVFAENVDGLVSMAQSGGEIVMEDETTICKEAEMVLETIRKDLEVEGYRSIPVVIPACSVGAAHRRYRIFIVAHSGHKQSSRRNETQEGHEYTQRWQTRSQFTSCSCNVANNEGERCGEARGDIKRSEEWTSGGGEVVANTEGKRLRNGDDGKNERQANREVYASPNTSASPYETLADTASKGLQGASRTELLREYRRSSASSENVADTSGARCEECNTSAATSESGYGSGSSDPLGAVWATQPRLGGGPYELSDWLDGWGMNPLDALINFISSYPQPALMGQEQYAWEPPRVATGVKNRAARLKALGNAVDPLQALPILYGIRVIHDFFLQEGGRLA
jgi:DNA-cytosine methyltransferase